MAKPDSGRGKGSARLAKTKEEKEELAIEEKQVLSDIMDTLGAKCKLEKQLKEEISNMENLVFQTKADLAQHKMDLDDARYDIETY